QLMRRRSTQALKSDLISYSFELEACPSWQQVCSMKRAEGTKGGSDSEEVMKKVLMTVLVISQLITSLAWAGISRFDSSQFNDIINENQKQEKELRHKLQNEAGIDYKLKKAPLKIDRKE